jgi:hypothetical protein
VLAATGRTNRQIRSIAHNPPSASVPTAESACRVILAITICKKQADKWIRRSLIYNGREARRHA